MRAGLRWKMILLGGGLLAAGAPALAQSVPETTSNTPSTDSIGPSELQNFSLPGTASKPADEPATVTPVAKAPARDASTVASDAQKGSVPVRREPLREAAREEAPARSAPVTSQPRALAASPPSLVPGKAADPSLSAPAAIAEPAPATAPDSAPSLASQRRPSILPWLLAAFVLAAGAALMFWRRNQQQEHAFAGGSDLFVPPEPAPTPAPAPAPRAARPQPPAERVSPPAQVPPQRAASRGIVASRLRPAIELGVQPLRCLVDQDQVTIEFEVELFNSGTAPARAVIAEASLFNASATQDQELAAFYAKPPAQGDRIDSIAPMRRMTFTNRVVAPRAAVQEYELGGRKSFVPVLAFNAQYEWSGGKGQSSLAFLLGRETRGDKLGPLHLDGAQNELRGLGARVLPAAVRT